MNADLSGNEPAQPVCCCISARWVLITISILRFIYTLLIFSLLDSIHMGAIRLSILIFTIAVSIFIVIGAVRNNSKSLAIVNWLQFIKLIIDFIFALYIFTSASFFDCWGRSKSMQYQSLSFVDIYIDAVAYFLAKRVHKHAREYSKIRTLNERNDA